MSLMFRGAFGWLAQLICALVFWAAGPIESAAGVVELSIDFAQTNGTFRPLHGINKGPLAAGGTIDLAEKHRALRIPFVRLHDCLWPHPDVVDMHAVFRDFTADPSDPANYDFALTDEYLAAVHETGAQMIYRLGESIEHMRAKRFVHPPKDPAKWAEICLGIIRHYNEGWAGGSRYGIRYWEIWNEPENRPAMWTGSDEEFLQLYATAAKAVKKAFPELRVGGPGFGYIGKLSEGKLTPTPFVLNFLKQCHDDDVPLDFFSWHCYTASPEELVIRAREVRKLLDAHGLARTESHLNEWNYLPDNSWEGFGRAASPTVRRAFYARSQGDEGAAFIVASLISLQDAPVDVCNFFHGEIGTFGLFDEFGGETSAAHAFGAFSDLQHEANRRVPLKRGGAPGIAAAAGWNTKDRAGIILIANAGATTQNLRLDLRGLEPSIRHGRMSVNFKNSEIKAIQRGSMEFPIAAHSVVTVRLLP